MSAASSYEALLPSDRLIVDCRVDGEATAIAGAENLRAAAAEVVREGYLLHYDKPRYYAFEDRDIALLAGDRMYAAALAALASEGDTEAVSALAALIAGCAEAHAVGDSDRTSRLWESTLAMLTPGSAVDGTA